MTFLKVIKTIKVFKQNIALKEIKKLFNYIDFFYNSGNIFLYIFFFFSFLNLGSCIFIFIGRNNDENWIYLGELQESNFIDIYFSSIQYLIETVTTVGYGELVGRSLNEIIFQIFMLIVGTCIYSWLISFISTYVKKNNEKYIKYEEKVQLLEEIKLNNPKFTENLYEKILKLLNYRKYHEEETEKKILFDSLPNSLKNTLVIEMYKSYINEFSFFRDIENREFIVQVISKLNPILGIKGDILVQEGEFFEDLIFIKSGFLSLELWINMIYPKDSIQNYLIRNGFINNLRIKKLKPKYPSDKSTISEYNYNNSNINIKNIKVLDIRTNQHFGEAFMFLNKKSPFYIRVGSKKADLLFLKKLDALNISYKFPNIWKNIIKKTLTNIKHITNLTYKEITTFCNLNGIKTKFFKKIKNKYYPSYYLIPNLKNFKRYSIKKSKTNKNENILNVRKKNKNLSLKKSFKNTKNKNIANNISLYTNNNKAYKENELANFIKNEKSKSQINDINYMHYIWKFNL